MQKLIILFLIFVASSSYALDTRPFNAVVLLSIDKGFAKFYCTGVAINPKKILTAAHCVDSAVEIETIFDESDRPRSKRRVAYDWSKHPDYDQKTSLYYYDLAIVYLENNAPRSTHYISIGRPDKSRSYIRFGYGMRDSKNIRTAIHDLKISEYNQGNPVITYKDLWGVIGDSGGPVYKVLPNNRYELISTHSTSFDFKKTGGPVLANLIDWIN